jgi:hypothetical protein
MPAICKTCLKSFSTAEKLDIHLNKGDCEKPVIDLKFVCELCKQGYTRKSALINHQQNKDSYCARINKVDPHLYHKENKNPEKNFKYKCELCKQGYTKKPALINHQQNKDSYCARINKVKQMNNDSKKLI